MNGGAVSGAGDDDETGLRAPTPLAQELRRLILADGPMPVSRFMALCLGHPVHGYYRSRDPLGADGDFTTAPEISQMFGELVGLWAVAVWQQMGSPDHVLLVEAGPGRGTLMADALRAARLVPAFREAAAVHLVETSTPLRARQRQALAASGAHITWHDDLATLPAAPLILIANEFIDALPVSQAVFTGRGWHERVVGLGADGRLGFGLAPDPLPAFSKLLPPPLRAQAQTKALAPGTVFEWRADTVLAELCRRIGEDGGAALIIDYGHGESGFGDTLQAVRGHAYADPLDAPGEADLTAHVDFAALRVAAEGFGAAAHGPVPQGTFLRRLGIAHRATRLKASATPAQAAAIDAALARLTGGEPGSTGSGNMASGGMGRLFKALAITRPAQPVPPGFDT